MTRVVDKLTEYGAPERTLRLVVAKHSIEDRCFRRSLEGEVT